MKPGRGRGVRWMLQVAPGFPGFVMASQGFAVLRLHLQPPKCRQHDEDSQFSGSSRPGAMCYVLLIPESMGMPTVPPPPSGHRCAPTRTATATRCRAGSPRRCPCGCCGPLLCRTAWRRSRSGPRRPRRVPPPPSVPPRPWAHSTSPPPCGPPSHHQRESLQSVLVIQQCWCSRTRPGINRLP